jgi:quinol-cytochrome oxidoreductase complex cytochrome b subunit
LELSLFKMNKLYFLSILAFVYFIQASESFAQELKITQPPNTGVQVGGRSGSVIVQNVYNSVVTIIYSVAILAFIIMLIWGALDIIVSGGNKDKIQAGRKRITTAIIGIAVLAFVFFIAQVLGFILGINLTGPIQIPSLLPAGGSTRP